MISEKKRLALYMPSRMQESRKHRKNTMLRKITDATVLGAFAILYDMAVLFLRRRKNA